MNLQLGVAKEAQNGFWMELCSNIALSEGSVESDHPATVSRDELACFLREVLLTVRGIATVKINGTSLTIFRKSTDILWHTIIPDVEEWTRRYCIATGRIYPL